MPPNVSSSDRELLRAYVQNSDEAAFRKLVERYVPMVRAVALRGVRDANLSEEITQNAFALLARKARKLSKEVTVSGWLFKTARYETLRLTRKEATRLKKMKHYAQESTLTEAAIHPEPNFREPLDDALSKLNENDRNAILLRFYESMSYRELGEKLGKTEAAAQKQVERSLDKLRVRLHRRGVAVTHAMIASAFLSQFHSNVQAANVAKLTSSSLSSTSPLTGQSTWINSLFTMASKSQIITTTTILLLTGFITWQAADLHASKQEIAELTERLQNTAPQETSANLAPVSSIPIGQAEQAAPTVDPEELPPIMIPTTAADGMRLYVSYKLKEIAGRQRYANKILPPGTPEREAYEQDKERWLADLSTMALAQGVLTKVWKSNDIDQLSDYFEVGYRELFDLEPAKLSELLNVTRSAVKGKIASRAEHSQGTPEAVEAEGILQKEMLDRASEILNDEQHDLFIGVFGKQPLTSVSINPPVIFDSEEQRARAIEAVSNQ